jgi:lipopolysaccharide export system permease protein
MRLDRYVLGSVLRGLAGVAVLLLALAFAIEWLDQRGGSRDIGDALVLAALVLPRRAIDLVPFVALFGVLLGLGALAATEELTAARAAGVSVRRLVGIALIPVAALGCLAVLAAEFMVPAAEARLAVLKAERRGADADSGLRWVHHADPRHDGSGAWIAAGAVSADGTLHGVRAFEFRGDVLASAWHARSVTPAAAVRADVGRGPPAQARDLAATTIVQDRVRATHAALAGVVLPVSGGAFTGYLARDAQRVGLRELQARIALLEGRPGQSARRLHAHYDNVRWQRLGQPVATLLLAALGGAFVFGSLRRLRVGVRMALGLLVALAFKYVSDLVAALVIILGLPGWASAAVPLCLLAWAAVASLRRAA